MIRQRQSTRHGRSKDLTELITPLVSHHHAVIRGMTGLAKAFVADSAFHPANNSPAIISRVRRFNDTVLTVHC